jgi:hypothetical protein
MTIRPILSKALVGFLLIYKQILQKEREEKEEEMAYNALTHVSSTEPQPYAKIMCANCRYRISSRVYGGGVNGTIWMTPLTHAPQKNGTPRSPTMMSIWCKL